MKTTFSQEKPLPKCWIYELEDGWKVFAGKTDEDNDLLSQYFAHPTEYWFHVSDVPGSHVILRPPEGMEDAVPTKQQLAKAAAVAAWHSKARNGGNCMVDMTLARYVTKPKNVKAGTVTITNSKKLRVKPALP